MNAKPWPLLLVILTVAIFYLPGFNGFWMGDEIAQIHRVYAWQELGTLWHNSAQFFVAADTSQGAFYRPLMLLMVSLNYVLAGAHYGGWFVVNFAVHLANTALIALIVMRLAAWCECDGDGDGGGGSNLAALIAALFFGLNPAIGEGVYWVSARSDGLVTLLSLVGVYSWLGANTRRQNGPNTAYLLPFALVLALGFKESAAVLPLQMLLLLLVMPDMTSRKRWLPVALCFVCVGLFLIWRSALFGDAWKVYSNAATQPLSTKLFAALYSLPTWWQGLMRNTPLTANIYAATVLIALLVLLVGIFGRQRRITIALLFASGGMALATLLNLGSMASSGEGGRLAYNPAAWLALAMGVAMARPLSDTDNSLRHPLAVAMVMCAMVLGAVALYAQLQMVWDTQKRFHAMAEAMPAWVAQHPGTSLLFMPEQVGMVVLGRNAQGGIVMPPIQPAPMLHRILPSLPGDMAGRYNALSQGLARRLTELAPRYVTVEAIKTFLVPTTAMWPDHVMCYAMREEKFIAITPPATDNAQQWNEAVAQGIAQCGL